MLLENKGEKNQDVERFYEGLMTARIKGTFMQESRRKEGRKEGRKELWIFSS